MAAQSAPLTFLLTRPAAASLRFAQALRESFGPASLVTISPLMQPLFLKPLLPEGLFDALILTSETGAEAARRLSADGIPLPALAFCVGDRTAQAAADAGFDPISADGEATALLRLIQDKKPEGRYLYLRGRDARGNILQQLDGYNIFSREAIVYDQQPCLLTPQATALLAGLAPVVLPLFSPRSADLLRQTGPVMAPLWIAALSPAVAQQARLLHPARLMTAQHPDAATLLQTIENLCGARGQA